MEQRKLSMTGEQIQEMRKEVKQFFKSRSELEDRIRMNHEHDVHESFGGDNGETCDECWETFEQVCIQEELDDKDLEEIMNGVSNQELRSLEKKLEETLKTMNITVEIEC